MKKVIIIFFFLPFLSFSSLDKCNNPVAFGDVIICMPEILNMTECYSNPTVKMFADLYKGTAGEEILGFFMSNNEYENLYSSLDNGLKEPYVKVYSTNLVKGINVSIKDLNTVSSGVKTTFDEYDGSNIESKINSRASDLNISFGKPILLEEYELRPNIKSFVSLMNFSAEQEGFIMVAVMNILTVKNRLIFIAYYDQYKNVKQIEKIKSNNDYFVLSVMAKN